MLLRSESGVFLVLLLRFTRSKAKQQVTDSLSPHLPFLYRVLVHILILQLLYYRVSNFPLSIFNPHFSLLSLFLVIKILYSFDWKEVEEVKESESREKFEKGLNEVPKDSVVKLEWEWQEFNAIFNQVLVYDTWSLDDLWKHCKDSHGVKEACKERSLRAFTLFFLVGEVTDGRDDYGKEEPKDEQGVNGFKDQEG